MTQVTQQISNLAVGDKVKDPESKFLNVPIIWQIADKNHPGYPENSVTLISERCLALRAFDAKEPNNSNAIIKVRGNNRYLYSNIRQWLNSNEGAGLWYTAQHGADEPPSDQNVTVDWENSGLAINPYDSHAGFLSGLSVRFKAALLPTTLIVARNTVTDGGGSDTVTDKVFLASNTEVGVANQNNITEGVVLQMFSGGVTTRIAKVTTEGIADSNYQNNPANNTASWDWWLRTPFTADAGTSNSIYDGGGGGWLGNHSSVEGFVGVRPLCNLPASILVSETADGDGCYTITAKPQLYSPFLGVFINKNGDLVDMFSGEVVQPDQIKPDLLPFNGVFVDKDGDEHDLSEML